jgi:tRNA U55 pseudouridine synthase TruB
MLKKQISQVSGNFRQEEILQNYNSAKFPLNLISVKIKVLMSRGLYVRGLVRDICQKLNCEGIVFNLVRTKDGKYEKKDCQEASKYFSDEISKDKNFLRPNFINL